MGYNTRFDLSVTGPEALLEEFQEAADNGEHFGEYSFELSEWFLNDMDSMKWYGWQKDVEELSSRFPHLLFAVEGEGEESGDIWKAWARNGKSVVVQAKIYFDEPDLDRDLPTPDVEKALALRLEAKVAEIDDEIARLNAKKRDLDPDRRVW